ncbi:MAG: class I SAM-dependent methyltransferase [Cellulosilyticaceae bacterium]
MDRPVLDACCGSRMFWFNKKNDKVVYMDNRKLEDTLCDGRKLEVNPDVVADFRDIPYADKSFKLVVFDPPHLIKAGENSWLAKKYGRLSDTWKKDINQGFNECMRVLDDYGVLIFKWNEEQVKLKDVLKAIGKEPLFGNKRSKTHWLVFMKI